MYTNGSSEAPAAIRAFVYASWVITPVLMLGLFAAAADVMAFNGELGVADDLTDLLKFILPPY